MAPNPEGDVKKDKKHQDVLFVLSTVPNLMPVVRLKDTSKSQAVFVYPEDKTVDLRSDYLSKLNTIEGLTMQEFNVRSNQEE